MEQNGQGYYRAFRVAEDEARERLDRFVERRIPNLSRGRIRTAIAAGQITIDGETRESGRRVRLGQLVEIRMPAPPIETMAPEPIPIRVVYEDEGMVVVDKPAGMFAHPTHRVHAGTLLNAVAHHLLSSTDPRDRVKPLLVHRLDRATSGLLVVSKLPRVHTLLAKDWSERRVEKVYLALVCGRLPSPDGIVDAPIGGSRDHHPGFRVMLEGRPARTRFHSISRYGPYTLVELEPLTGRTNQLRIHMDYIGAPIAGDDLHGLPNIERFRTAHGGAPYPGRLFLHAARLAFTHPLTRERLELEAPLPPELEAFLAELQSKSID